jgi:type IV secretory pathway VirB3-like protein
MPTDMLAILAVLVVMTMTLLLANSVVLFMVILPKLTLPRIIFAVRLTVTFDEMVISLVLAKLAQVPRFLG